MDLKDIWGEEPNFKLFLSHKSEFRKESAVLKKNLSQYGISCFVAHNDVKPTSEWQKVIEEALFSADALVALMTEKFFESVWTNQEIGIAIGRNIFILPVRLGSDPKGFISQFQALTCNLEKEYKKIVYLLLKKSEKMIDIFIKQVEDSNSWIKSNDLATFLSDIKTLNNEQIDKLIKAYNTNQEVNGSMGFNGSKPHLFGNGLFSELKRITGKDLSHLKNIKT